MYPGLNKEAKLYYCKKLKWYQKILQKLHIKNYWKEVKCVKGIKLVGDTNVKD